MISPSSFLQQRRLDRAVRVLCPFVEEKVASRSGMTWTENDLRRELVSCILGSQVRYESAVEATINLASAGLLDDKWWQPLASKKFEARVLSVLAGRNRASRSSKRYRFPVTRSRQLQSVRDALACEPLVARLAHCCDPWRLRRQLVSVLAGVGPKQASMFLRNTGTSYELAILDTHVLRFIEILQLGRGATVNIGSVGGYERTERTIVRYADALGYPAGYLDVAIWATMRAARELEQ